MKSEDSLAKVENVFEHNNISHKIGKKRIFLKSLFQKDFILIFSLILVTIPLLLGNKYISNQVRVDVESELNDVKVEKAYLPSGNLLNVSWKSQSKDGVFEYSYKKTNKGVVYKNIKADLGDVSVTFNDFLTKGVGMDIKSKNCEKTCEYYIEKKNSKGVVENISVNDEYFMNGLELSYSPSRDRSYKESYLVETENGEIKNKYSLNKLYKYHDIHFYKEKLGNEEMISAFKELDEQISFDKK